MSAPKFPHVHVQLTDMDENSFAILGRVIAAMKEAAIDQTEIDDYLKRVIASDYDSLLKVSMETITIAFA